MFFLTDMLFPVMVFLFCFLISNVVDIIMSFYVIIFKTLTVTVTSKARISLDFVDKKKTQVFV